MWLSILIREESLYGKLGSIHWSKCKVSAKNSALNVTFISKSLHHSMLREHHGRGRKTIRDGSQEDLGETLSLHS